MAQEHTPISRVSSCQRPPVHFTLAPREGPPQAHDPLFRAAELRWVVPDELENYAFPPADQATTDLLLEINRDAQLAEQTPAKTEHVQGQEPAMN